MLNERQIRFCEEYIACKFNGTQAAINAGYSEKTAKEIASENLTKPHIQEYLSKLIEKDAESVGITKERVMQEIGRLAFADHRKFFDDNGNLKPIKDLDDEAASILAGFEVTEETEWVEGAKSVTGFTKKIKTYDKTKALEMLAKHFKIYTDAPVTNNNLKFGYGPEQPV